MTLLSRLVAPPGTKGPFCPGWCYQPGQKGWAFYPGWSHQPGQKRGPFVPDGANNRDKKGSFCPGWCLQPGQKTHVPPLARLAVGPGTKVTYCPGPKGCRDKWPETKTYYVFCSSVTYTCKQAYTNHVQVLS